MRGFVRRVSSLGTAQHTRLLGYNEFSGGITREGARIYASQPRFTTLENTGSFLLEQNTPILAGIHFLPDQKETVELFFLRGWTVRKPASLQK